MNTTAGNDNASFDYSALDASKREIRLLVLNRVDSSRSLHFTLHSVSLDAHSPFVALSYAWGFEDADKQIYVNDCPFNIRQNLYGFLAIVAVKRLLGVPLFVDAVCINQADVGERESQIGMMREVYAGASEVIAWLGPSQFSPEAEAHIKEKAQDQEDVQEWIMSGKTKMDDLIRRVKSIDDQHLMFENIEAVYYSAHYQALERCFWERLWIVQEVMLASRLTLQVGDLPLEPSVYIEDQKARMPNDAVTQLFNLLPDSATLTIFATRFRVLSGNPVFKAQFVAYSMFMLREKWRSRLLNGPPIKLYEILTRFGDQKCREPGDKIFGLLGIAASGIRPDYNVDLLDLYTYVLAEGLSDMLRGEDYTHLLDPRHHEIPPWTFVEACLSSFDFSIAQPLIAAITHKVLETHNMRLHTASILLIAWVFYAFRNALQGIEVNNGPHGSWLMNLVWCGEVVLRLLFALLCLVLQTVRLEVSRFFDHQLIGPGGEHRSYSGWMRSVDETIELVKLGKPLKGKKHH